MIHSKLLNWIQRRNDTKKNRIIRVIRVNVRKRYEEKWQVNFFFWFLEYQHINLFTYSLKEKALLANAIFQLTVFFVPPENIDAKWWISFWTFHIVEKLIYLYMMPIFHVNIFKWERQICCLSFENGAHFICHDHQIKLIRLYNEYMPVSYGTNELSLCYN